MKTSKNYRNNSEYHNLNVNNSEDKNCCLKFSHCDDNKYQLWNLGKDEIKRFISYAKKVESLQWQQIKTSKGLHYETLSNMKVPTYIDSNIVIKSMRVDSKFRLIGYRSDQYFYILWFDNNHETC